MNQLLHHSFPNLSRFFRYSQRLGQRCWQRSLGVLTGIVIAGLWVTPGQGAERIYFHYGLLEFPVSVQHLETFAHEGTIHRKLRPYLARLNSAQRSQLQQVLLTRYPVNPVMVDRLAYTTSGVQLFTELGSLIRTQSGLNGLSSIRAAAILAAADPDGFSAIGFLQQLPTDIRIDIRQLLRTLGRFRTLVAETHRSMGELEASTKAIASSPPLPLPDIRQLGTFAPVRQTLTLHDHSRDRTLVVDLYLPNASTDQSLPIIIVSNGLGARRDHFEELATHLSSYGFAVVIPDHPGSDRDYLRAFFAGLHRENFEATEYIDRPLDISFVLDELQRRNATEFGDRLNLSQVGMFGYSFGGSTALSLAGAQIDGDYLKQDCASESALINISLLYQCRALEVPNVSRSLKDERIKAIFLYVPFGKSLFGSSGMGQVTIPIFWKATNEDILTPLVVEQLPAFRWLTGSDRYLAVADGLPHARVTFDVLERLTGRDRDWNVLRSLIQTQQNVLSLAFFKVYVVGDQTYHPYLHPSYGQTLADPPYRLNLVHSWTQE